MKRFLLFLSTSFLLLSAQDTTALRFVGVGPGNKVLYLTNDSSDIENFGQTGSRPMTAVFMNPADSMVYMIGTNGSTDINRNLYTLNPFIGDTALVRDLPHDYIASAAISADGSTIYYVLGNGAGSTDKAKVYSYNITTSTATLLTRLILDDPTYDESRNSFGIALNTNTNTLYCFTGSYNDQALRLQKYDISANVLSPRDSIGEANQLHGAYYTGAAEDFIIWGGYDERHRFYNGTSVNFIQNNGSDSRSNLISDADHFQALKNNANYTVCSGDSVKLEARYDNIGVTWYKDGVSTGETTDIIYATTSGTYRALFTIGGTPATSYMWSETIVINTPNVTITQATNDTLICPSETVVLDGASVGDLQWYRNGVAIMGATGSSYSATMPGFYNQTQTFEGGCADSANVAYHLVDCTIGLEENTIQVAVYPNPADDFIAITSDNEIRSVAIISMQGKVVVETVVNATSTTIPVYELSKGTYVLKITSASNKLQYQKFVK